MKYDMGAFKVHRDEETFRRESHLACKTATGRNVKKYNTGRENQSEYCGRKYRKTTLPSNLERGKSNACWGCEKLLGLNSIVCGKRKQCKRNAGCETAENEQRISVKKTNTGCKNRGAKQKVVAMKLLNFESRTFNLAVEC